MVQVVYGRHFLRHRAEGSAGCSCCAMQIGFVCRICCCCRGCCCCDACNDVMHDAVSAVCTVLYSCLLQMVVCTRPRRPTGAHEIRSSTVGHCAPSSTTRTGSTVPRCCTLYLSLCVSLGVCVSLCLVCSVADYLVREHCRSRRLLLMTSAVSA